jgi:hypothetical protein
MASERYLGLALTGAALLAIAALDCIGYQDFLRLLLDG